VLLQEAQSLFLALEAQKYIWVSASGTFWVKIQNSSAVFSNEKENLFDCIRVGKILSEMNHYAFSQRATVHDI
jgi:hypothetical protein